MSAQIICIGVIKMSKEEFENFKKEDKDVSEIISKFHQELIDKVRALEK